MRQPKAKSAPVDPENMHPFYKNEFKYRTASFVLGVVATTAYIMAWRSHYSAMAFVSVLLMFLGAIIAIAGLLFASLHKNIKVVMHLCLIVMWLVLTPLITMSMMLKSMEADGKLPAAQGQASQGSANSSNQEIPATIKPAESSSPTTGNDDAGGAANEGQEAGGANEAKQSNEDDGKAEEVKRHGIPE